MGREVASAYRRRKYTFASVSPTRLPAPSPYSSSMESLPDKPDNLTPARKHHKLLKDGSEVWSKDVEKIFVEGPPPLSPRHACPLAYPSPLAYPPQVFASTGSPPGRRTRVVAAGGATSSSLTTSRRPA